jgi:hypothetical protein
MTLFSFSESERVAAVATEYSQRLLSAFGQSDIDRGLEIRSLAERLSYERVAGHAPELVIGRRLYGAGVVQLPGDEHPLVVVNEDLAPSEFVPLEKAPTARELLMSFAGEPPPDAWVIGIPEPRPFFGPGDRAYCWAKHGTLGARVVSAKREAAFLTAGHFGTPVGASVGCGNKHLGRVAFSIDPAQMPAGTASADVAVVVVDDPAAAAGGARVAGAATASGGCRVTCIAGGSGTWTATVMAKSAFIYIPSMTGMWGDTYMTLQGPSVPGDSGAPVFLEGTENLIGHTVGGAPGVMSFIQDIDLQLQATGATLDSMRDGPP